MLESLFNKVAGLKASNFTKTTFQQVFSGEICEILEITLFYKKPPVATSAGRNWLKINVFLKVTVRTIQ